MKTKVFSLFREMYHSLLNATKHTDFLLGMFMQAVILTCLLLFQSNFPHRQITVACIFLLISYFAPSRFKYLYFGMAFQALLSGAIGFVWPNMISIYVQLMLAVLYGLILVLHVFEKL